MTRVEITFSVTNTEDPKSPHKIGDFVVRTYGSIENGPEDFVDRVLPKEKYPKTYTSLTGVEKELNFEYGDVCCNAMLPPPYQCCSGEYFSHIYTPISIEIVSDERWERALRRRLRKTV